MGEPIGTDKTFSDHRHSRARCRGARSPATQPQRPTGPPFLCPLRPSRSLDPAPLLSTPWIERWKRSGANFPAGVPEQLCHSFAIPPLGHAHFTQPGEQHPCATQVRNRVPTRRIRHSPKSSRRITRQPRSSAPFTHPVHGHGIRRTPRPRSCTKINRHDRRRHPPTRLQFRQSHLFHS